MSDDKQLAPPNTGRVCANSGRRYFFESSWMEIYVIDFHLMVDTEIDTVEISTNQAADIAMAFCHAGKYISQRMIEAAEAKYAANPTITILKGLKS